MENTYPQKKREKYLELHNQLLCHGIKRIKYVSLQLQPEEDIIINKTFITFLIVLKLFLKRGKLPTVECLPKNKWTTLNDKKSFSSLNSLTTTWLQTLVLESTSIEKDLKPFWNSQCLENSQKLWLPIETDSVDSHLSCLKKYSDFPMSNSLFSMETLNNPQTLMKNSQMTSYQLSTSIPVENLEDENIRLKTRMVRIYPTKKQKILFNNWIGTSRFIYNKCVKEVKDNGLEELKGFKLRDKFITYKTKDGIINPNVKEWETETPKGPRDGAVRDFKKAYNTAFTNLKNGNISKFNVGFRSKKNTQSIEIPNTSIKKENNKLKIYSNVIKTSKKDKTLNNINHYCRLTVTKNKNWYLLVPIDFNIKKVENKNLKCSLDPGIRKFVTLYSEKEVIKCRTNTELLKKLRDKISILQSNRKNGIFKRWDRHNNLITDFHFKLSNYLCRNYSEIFLPRFESQKLTKKLGRTSNFNILNLQHYKFKERLKAKSLEYNSKIRICSEEYTSKTCTRCGIMNEKLGASETFKCSNCKLEIDRDINGARNIYLKCLITR